MRPAFAAAASGTLLLYAAQAAAVAVTSPAALLQPTRGWNAWFAFDTHLNETNVASNAAALVSTGLAQAGYTLVALDGGWQGGRFSNGTVFANATVRRACACCCCCCNALANLNASTPPPPCRRFLTALQR